jgi:hypothetical protein
LDAARFGRSRWTALDLEGTGEVVLRPPLLCYCHPQVKEVKLAVCRFPAIGQTQPMLANTKNELKRYKRAADHALRQLDWCVNYLEGIQKDKAAQALKQNRDFIAKQIGHV